MDDYRQPDTPETANEVEMLLDQQAEQAVSNEASKETSADMKAEPVNLEEIVQPKEQLEEVKEQPEELMEEAQEQPEESELTELTKEQPEESEQAELKEKQLDELDAASTEESQEGSMELSMELQWNLLWKWKQSQRMRQPEKLNHPSLVKLLHLMQFMILS